MPWLGEPTSKWSTIFFQKLCQLMRVDAIVISWKESKNEANENHRVKEKNSKFSDTMLISFGIVHTEFVFLDIWWISISTSM